MNTLVEVSKTLIPTKGNISLVAEDIATNVLNGEVDAVKTAIQLKAVVSVCDEALKLISSSILTEVKKYGKEGAKLLGAKVEEMEAGTKYDYKESEAWNKYNNEIEKLDKKRKEVEKIAKTLPDGSSADYTDVDTGEVMKVVRPSKTSTTTFKVILGA